MAVTSRISNLQMMHYSFHLVSIGLSITYLVWFTPLRMSEVSISIFAKLKSWSYLGLPLNNNPKLSSFPTVEKIRRILNGWKKTFIFPREDGTHLSKRHFVTSPPIISPFLRCKTRFSSPLRNYFGSFLGEDMRVSRFMSSS